ncbi:hydrogenase maturation protease [Ruminiclostridium cellulolyticum]|uniref:Hydrogenase maturation protease n=1 Tax=Ruminiclostridium cellulolyticum (strain ATCC 35319 / DSM 5812 / JCM 6584 / H10) TaxID=394503 RepID=B8HZT1_RUMCH|nr:hydrogenase maturation protease [Ruminiclostridium cellulolyticum]ACL75431.1 hydrogenase maturation protease [Ruminiclostridium cellulolyticum H10]
MKELIVIGIGNRLMMDDGIGVRVVEELKSKNTKADILYVVGETDVYYCLNQIEDALMVIIIDAVYLKKEPGSISIIPFDRASENYINPMSVHDCNLLGEMRGKNIKGVLIGIEPYEINYSTSLSEVLESRYIRISEDIGDIIEDFTKNKRASQD